MAYFVDRVLYWRLENGAHRKQREFWDNQFKEMQRALVNAQTQAVQADKFVGEWKKECNNLRKQLRDIQNPALSPPPKAAEN